MEILGFEPKTSCLQSKRATNCAKFPALFHALRGAKHMASLASPNQSKAHWLRQTATRTAPLAPHRGAKQFSFAKSNQSEALRFADGFAKAKHSASLLRGWMASLAKPNQCSTVCHIIKNKK